MSGLVEPQDLTSQVDIESLLRVRQHALDMAIGTDTPDSLEDLPIQRRQRITADAAAWTRFILTGKIAGS